MNTATQARPTVSIKGSSVEPFVDTKTVADYYGISTLTVTKMAKEGTIPFKQVGARRRFKLSEVERAL